MKNKYTHSIFVVLLAFCLLCAGGMTGYARIEKPDSHLMETGYNHFRPTADYAFQNPLFVSGAGTNLLADGHYYNLIESDYYKAHKDEYFKKAYDAYLAGYQNWRSAPEKEGLSEESKQAILDRMVFNADGVFKAYKDDYANPAKTVYLTVIAETADEVKSVAANDGVTLIYHCEQYPCAVIRFQGNEALFNRIIDDPDVLFVEPAFQENNYSVLIMTGKATKTPADARDVLRYAVGLSVSYETRPRWSLANAADRFRTSEREFFISSDLNFDGHVTPEDARLALRIAVKLDEAPTLDTDV